MARQNRSRSARLNCRVFTITALSRCTLHELLVDFLARLQGKFLRFFRASGQGGSACLQGDGKLIAEGAKIRMLADPLLRLTVMKTYRGFPERLHHGVPHWVEPGALFHIRIALDCEKEQKALIDPPLAQAILDSVKFYQFRMRWRITPFLLMPDHLHALLSFALANTRVQTQSRQRASPSDERIPAPRIRLPRQKVAASFPNHLLKRASSEGDKRSTSASRS
jgi:hypothetical protein